MITAMVAYLIVVHGVESGYIILAFLADIIIFDAAGEE